MTDNRANEILTEIRDVLTTIATRLEESEQRADEFREQAIRQQDAFRRLYLRIVAAVFVLIGGGGLVLYLLLR